MPHILENLISSDDIANIATGEHLVLDDEDRISILKAMHSIDVQACPGSGKTTLIATKLILLAKKWPLQNQGICVLSHTNVAKDEIIDRIKQSTTIEAQRLLSYPHFIGTIQEFVGKYIALPLIRSSGTSINMIDTDACVKLIYSRLPIKTRSYVEKRSQYSNILYDFNLSYADGIISINVPTFPNGSDSQSYRDLLSIRKGLIKDGYFFYRDIFPIALMAVRENKALKSTLRQKFQCVFLDEMQDTQKYQDELLCEIFPLDDSSFIVQRFGDPDQAIFHGMGNEEPNESFNGKSRDEMNFVIHKSHRFDAVLANKIKHFSLNEIPLESEVRVETADARTKACTTNGDFEHTIIVFDDNTRGKVIDFFANLVSNQFTAHHKSSPTFSVKVVGAVGNEIDPNSDQLKIGHYWLVYDKTKSQKNFRETSLVDAIRYCRLSSNKDFSESYQFLIDCFLKLLRMIGSVDEDDRNFSATTLRNSLKKRGIWDEFRKEIYLMLNSTDEINQQNWKGTYNRITALFGFGNIPVEAAEYLSFTRELAPTDVAVKKIREDSYCVSLPGNKIKHSDGFEIELSTIHGVKGETHDATLIVETKNHTFDLGNMLPYLTGEFPSKNCPNTDLPERPHAKRQVKQNRTFMRQFYVGMSRPRYLLCLALHADRISNADRDTLSKKGWRIEII